MKTKIYDALKTKFVGVSDSTLNRIAEKAAKTVTEEDTVQSYVDSVTFQSVIDSEADYRATKATQTSIENYEKKHNLKDGQKIRQEPSGTKTDDSGKDDDKIPSWAKDILANFTILKEEQEKQTLKAKKGSLVDKVVELGADKNDTELIGKLVEMLPININDDIDEKANSIMTIYNSFKKPIDSGTPDTSKSGKGDDDFAKMLEDVKGENVK